MKKLILGIFSAVLFLTIITPVQAATDRESFYAEMRSNLTKAKCVAPVDGQAIMNISHTVVNDIDSGQAGNYWAYDQYTRIIEVYKYTDFPAYCAIVRYVGKFDAQAGQVSPGGAYTLDGNEDGLFKGGYIAKIIGTLNENNTLPLKGDLGQMDYQCDITTANCPGRWSWTDAYFSPNYHFTYLWWGWLYEGFSHGFWINAVTGNVGDIN